ncbi:MAG TPA: ChbG/HpnK family deacetylase, partial [Thermoanaerobaculia bacterium]
PRIFEIVMRLAEEHGIRFVRIPCEPKTGVWSARSAQLAVLNHLGRRARQRLGANNHLEAVERTLGVADAGHLTVDRLRRALEGAAGTNELVCHPGLGDAGLAADYDWDYDWDAETAALCDPRVPGILREAGIELTRFSRL